MCRMIQIICDMKFGLICDMKFGLIFELWTHSALMSCCCCCIYAWIKRSIKVELKTEVWSMHVWKHFSLRETKNCLIVCVFFVLMYISAMTSNCMIDNLIWSHPKTCYILLAGSQIHISKIPSKEVRATKKVRSEIMYHTICVCSYRFCAFLGENQYDLIWKKEYISLFDLSLILKTLVIFHHYS